MDGQKWRGLKQIAFSKFEKRQPTFLKIYGMSVYTCNKIILSFTQLKNHSQLLSGHNFANKILLVCQFDI